MKISFGRALCLSLLVAVRPGLNAVAAGTVNFVNGGSCLMTNSFTGKPVAGADGVQAALYWAPVDSTSFVQIGPIVDVGAVIPGIFAGGTCTTGPGTAGGTGGQFQVRAWGGGYATYEQAVAMNQALTSTSAVIEAATGNPAGGPPTPPGSLVAAGLATMVIQAVPQPTLKIFATNSNVVLAWPASAGNFQLQSALNPMSGWNAAGGQMLTNGVNATVTLPSTNLQQYFRLLGP